MNALTARIESARDAMPQSDLDALMSLAAQDSLAYLDDPYALALERGIVGGVSAA